MRILCWNVNGIRAGQKKGLLEWLYKESPDILCVQETKAMPEQLDDALIHPKGYNAYYNSAERKGYSGVAIFSKKEAIKIIRGFGVKRFDVEGRAILAEFETFMVLNIYFPNGKKDSERLKYKLDFYDETLKFVEKLKQKKKPVIICGDYNTAHKPIDLSRPKENEKVSGFLPEERAWIDKWEKAGQVDVFREFCKESNQYTWWDMKTRARDRNIGWRIDYHFVTKDLVPKVKAAAILSDVMGSDHCPISIEFSE